jgi:hypothetical protein
VTEPGGGERRSGKRARARLPVRLWNDQQQGHGHTCDLSCTGMFVETAAALEIGTRLHFEIQHADGPFLGEALVVRKKKVPPRLRAVVKPGIGLSVVPLTALLKREEPPTAATAAYFELPMDLSDPALLERCHAGELRGGVLFVACDSPPAPGTAVHVRVKLPAPYEPLTWRGRVVQQSEQPRGAAVELADRSQVAALVQEILDACRA